MACGCVKIRHPWYNIVTIMLNGPWHFGSACHFSSACRFGHAAISVRNIRILFFYRVWLKHGPIGSWPWDWVTKFWGYLDTFYALKILCKSYSCRVQNCWYDGQYPESPCANTLFNFLYNTDDDVKPRQVFLSPIAKSHVYNRKM